MVRLKYMSKYGDPADPTWDNVDISIWSVIENAVAVICACLPALRPLLNRLVPQMFSSTHSATRSRLRGTLNQHKSEHLKGMQHLTEDESPLYLATKPPLPVSREDRRGGSLANFSSTNLNNEIEMNAFQGYDAKLEREDTHTVREIRTGLS